jgi:hypothetical protein
MSEMLTYVRGPGHQYAEWLASNPDDFLIAVDLEFGPGGPPRATGGHVDYGKNKLGSLTRVLHHATCEKITSPGPYDTSVCGTRDELAEEFEGKDIRHCPVCHP